MISFITSNRHKVDQANQVFSKYNLKINHINESYDEPSDDDSKTIVIKAVNILVSRFNKPIMIEDTSFFFDAYPDFPGALAKFVFEGIGYEGIYRLIDGKRRTGFFVSCVGYKEPGKEPIIIEEKMNGQIADKVYDKDKVTLPYSRIFIPDGLDKTISAYDEKTIFPMMHRTKAFEKLAKMIK